MDSTLNLISAVVGYSDLGATSNPRKRTADWSQDRSYAARNVQSIPDTIAPGETLNLFNALRTTSIDNTTEFTLSLSPLGSGRYRFTHTAGTAPSLRTSRGLTLATSELTWVVNSNATVSITSDAVGDFAGVVVGDTVFIPGVSTGDPASVFNVLNEGYWVVLDVDGTDTILQLSRGSGQAFVGVGEVVTVVSNSDFQAYSALGVQVGDSVTIQAGFPSSVQKTYVIMAINPSWFEVVSSSPLPVSSVAVPTITGIFFYNGAKRYIRVIADQECVLRLNGDTGASNRISPWVAGDPEETGVYEKAGPVWSATIENLSSSPLELLFISAE